MAQYIKTFWDDSTPEPLIELQVLAPNFKWKTNFDENKALAKEALLSPIVYVTDGTKHEANAVVKSVIAESLVDGEQIDVQTYMRAIQKGILIFCKTIGRFYISLTEVSIITTICMLAIQEKKDSNHPYPLRLTKKDIVDANEYYQEIMKIK